MNKIVAFLVLAAGLLTGAVYAEGPHQDIIRHALTAEPAQRAKANAEMARLPNLPAEAISEALKLMLQTENPNADWTGEDDPRLILVRLLRRSLMAERDHLAESSARPVIEKRLTDLIHIHLNHHSTVQELVSLKRAADLWTFEDIPFVLQYIQKYGAKHFGRNLLRLAGQMDPVQFAELKKTLSDRPNFEYSQSELANLFLLKLADNLEVQALIQSYGRAYASFKKAVEREMFPAVMTVSAPMEMSDFEFKDYVVQQRRLLAVREAAELNEYTLAALNKAYLARNPTVMAALISVRVLGENSDGKPSPLFLEFTRKLQTSGFVPSALAAGFDKKDSVVVVDFINRKRCENDLLN